MMRIARHAAPCVHGLQSVAPPSPTPHMCTHQHCRDGLIAVNYAARDAGITRHMRVAEARAKCPSLVCVHVQTIGATG